MKQNRIIMGAIRTMIGSLAIAVVSQAAQGQGQGAQRQGSQDPGPCQQIVADCKNAGFVQGDWKEGNGLWKDCVGPIMQGTTQPQNASKPLPQVSPQIVEECKAKHPEFGNKRGNK